MLTNPQKERGKQCDTNKNLLTLGSTIKSLVGGSQKVKKVTHIFTALHATMIVNVELKN